jgi:hypothetical protein
VHAHLTSKEIAPLLGIEPGSVDQHIKAAMKVLGVTDRRTAARMLHSFESEDPAALFELDQFLHSSRSGGRTGEHRNPAGPFRMAGVSPPVNSLIDILAADFFARARAETERRASAYEGFWRTTRPSLMRIGSLFHDHGMIRPAPNGLLEVRMGGAGLGFRGWGMVTEGNLFCINHESAGQTPVFLIYKAVSLPKATRLDGLMLFTSLDAGRIPAALPTVVERIGDLTHDPATDDAYCDELSRRESVASGSDVPKDLAAYLLRNFGPDAAASGGDLFLTASGAFTQGVSPSGEVQG